MEGKAPPVKILFALTLAFVCIAPAAAIDTSDLKQGSWHYRSIPCVETTVTDVAPRLGEEAQTKFPAQQFKETGVQVVFATSLGVDPLFPRERVRVVHYQNEPGNSTMIAERRGDHVQVCFLGYPLPTKYCDPDTDDRGRTYRVYDYRRHASYTGSNSEHDCGGA